MDAAHEDLTVITEEPLDSHDALADLAGVVVGTGVLVGMVLHRVHAGAWTAGRQSRRLHVRST